MSLILGFSSAAIRSQIWYQINCLLPDILNGDRDNDFGSQEEKHWPWIFLYDER